MILYHTSDREIRYPDIHYGRKNADFGWGFYLTPDREFTYRWARDNAVVNEYELDVDPSQTTLETWQKFSFSMLDLAKRMGLE